MRVGRASRMAGAQRGAQRVEAVSAALAAARARNGHPIFVGVLELYCEVPACPIREITLHVKEDDGVALATLRCPACRDQLKLHHVLTRAERDAEDRRWARISTAVQRYERDHPNAFGIPIGACLDERLP